MSWMRTRIWVGRHPILSVNLLTLAWVAAGIGAIWFLDHFHSRLGIPDAAAGPIALSVVILIALGIVVSTCMAGLVLGRAGMTAANVLGAMKYAPLVTAALGVAILAWVYVAGLIREGPFFDPPALGRFFPETAVFWALGTLFVMALQAAGWGVAGLVSRWKLGRGRWEVTRPPRAEVRRPSWLERRPAVAVNALAAVVFFAYSPLLVGFSSLLSGRWWSLGSLRWTLVIPPGALLACGWVAALRLGRQGRSTMPVVRAAIPLPVAAAASAVPGGLLWPALASRFDLWGSMSRVPLNWTTFAEYTVGLALVSGMAVVLGWAVGQWHAWRGMRGESARRT